MLIIIGAISLIFVALIGIGLFVDVEYDDHIENGRYTYVPEEENKDNEYVEFTINDYDKNNAKLVYYDTIEEAIDVYKRQVEAWYMKVKPTSIAATTIVTLLSGKTTAICRAWKKTWIKRWLQNF